MKADVAPTQIQFGLIDCDLFDGYIDAFPWMWSRLDEGGLIYLDEFYSLKFPGARRAMLKLISNLEGFELIGELDDSNQFERWFIKKHSSFGRGLVTASPGVYVPHPLGHLTA